MYLKVNEWTSYQQGSVLYDFNNSPYIVKEQEYKTSVKNAWVIISLFGGAGGSQTANRMNFQRAYIDFILAEFKATNDWFIRPTSLKDIWQTTTWTIYWKHIDNTYYWWIMIEKTEEAYTWNITPWNFAWYIVVNFNWELIRIPYYHDSLPTV